LDRYDRPTRSRVMAQIRKSHTKLEDVLVAILNSVGLTEYARYPKGLPGSPDFVFQRERVAIFLDSCFWHGCPKHLRMPTSNLTYWSNKIAGNRERDRRQTRELKDQGWRVLRLWEHELRRPNAVTRKIHRTLDAALQR